MVDVVVENADALDRPTDVLVLKYAQGFYGADAAAAARIDEIPGLPKPGTHCLVRDPRGIAARTLVFLGVEPLNTFAYADIRNFGARAIAVAATERLRAEEISMTLHGVGFGLDETEAFRSELAGILDGLTTGAVEPTLRRVVVTENDSRRVDRLRGLLRDVLDGERFPVDITSARRTLEPAGSGTVLRKRAFVSMPFDPVYEDRFHYGITPPLHGAGFLCERLDKVSFTGDIVQAMERRIRSADVVVADISHANPNVYLEVGYAWAAGRPTILLCDAESEPHFNVRGHRYLKFTSIRELEHQLATEVAALRSKYSGLRSL